MASFTPLDGRLPSLQTLGLPLTGGEMMYIVSPGNNAQGNSYNVLTSTLASFFAAFPALNRSVITSGATSGSPYLVQPTDTQVVFDKAIGSASYARLPLAGSMTYPFPILFKDWKGDAATNAISLSFSGGQTCDGLTQVTIQNAFGWVWLAPGPEATGATGWAIVG